MSGLIESHRVFLHKFKILDSLVLDGSGMQKSQIVETMKKEGYLVVVGVDACYRNHSIRKKSWHCVECDPKRLSFQGRFNKKSTVYIAESKLTKLIKIGMGDYSFERVKQLNYYNYAGVSDWTLAVSMQCNNAGRVEYDLHTALSEHKVRDKYYYKNGSEINCHEVFDCTLSEARTAFERVSGKSINTNLIPDKRVIMSSKMAVTATLNCIKTTVAQFAAELGLPTALLLDQLKSAGVVKSALEDKLEESDKSALLEYLRKEHGADSAPKSKITLTRKSNTEIKKTDSSGRARTIQVEVRKTSFQDRINALNINQKLEEADALRNKYFMMDKHQLLNLWNSGNNDFENDERLIIRIAIKNKPLNI